MSFRDSNSNTTTLYNAFQEMKLHQDSHSTGKRDGRVLRPRLTYTLIFCKCVDLSAQLMDMTQIYSNDILLQSDDSFSQTVWTVFLSVTLPAFPFVTSALTDKDEV